jgi:hypothetical protein
MRFGTDFRYRRSANETEGSSATQPTLECGSLLPLSKAAASRRTPKLGFRGWFVRFKRIVSIQLIFGPGSGLQQFHHILAAIHRGQVQGRAKRFQGLAPRTPVQSICRGSRERLDFTGDFEDLLVIDMRPKRVLKECLIVRMCIVNSGMRRGGDQDEGRHHPPPSFLKSRPPCILRSFRAAPKCSPPRRPTRGLTAYDQFLAFAFGQLTCRESLRDVVACLRARGSLRDGWPCLGSRSSGGTSAASPRYWGVAALRSPAWVLLPIINSEEPLCAARPWRFAFCRINPLTSGAGGCTLGGK